MIAIGAIPASNLAFALSNSFLPSNRFSDLTATSFAFLRIVKNCCITANFT